MRQPSNALLENIQRVSAAALAVRRISRAIIQQAHAEGFTFPDLLDHVLHELERELDDIQLLTKPERLSNAQDQPRRDNPEATTAAYATAQDGRETLR